MSQLEEGTVVATKYRVERVIGRGGMGVVYRAAQLPMDRAVALKVLRRELVGDPRARARFEREARVASALAHRAAVAIHDFGEHEGMAYLAMELVEGRGLRAILEATVSTERAIELACQLADVLCAAHRIGLVHRDLKPENVIVQSVGGEDVVRVLDFGLAFLLERGPAGRMTREGVVVGTPEYVSPEQARGDDVGPPTDVYALGCVLHELLVGRPPFTGTDMDVLTKQMFAPPPPLRREGTPLEVPAAIDELRRAMLDKRAAHRPSAEEVRDRLAALDPDPVRARARARVDGFLGPRAERMVDASAIPKAPTDEPLEVAVVGSLDADLVLGLAANAITAFALTPEDAPGSDTAAIFAPGASEDDVRRLGREGLPVVTDAERGDVARLSGLLRAGAADVIVRPVGAASLARKLRRLARDRAHRARR